MRKLYLTIPDDIIAFRKNYHLYKDSVSLPKNVQLKIDKHINNDNKVITSNELKNLSKSLIHSLF